MSERLSFVFPSRRAVTSHARLIRAAKGTGVNVAVDGDDRVRFVSCTLYVRDSNCV